ncbi:hypothetical protein OHB26_37530 [Nocardia sp. NBC_01503]|uniref:hypothetical protein n=1 Tax=Nocardia sp. NBC_01503 TaxID=2975997 RepID=UPI002E7C4AEB|nr:hypothetical protein [Nocardia sp. NBC_01503]WTL32496.1 hypothetical protein OHB26_37530 [Nocardia sp. NBC_01503]
MHVGRVVAGFTRDSRARRVVGGAVAAALVLLIPVLGWAIPPRAAIISTDRLGPENSEPVAAYLARAQDTLAGNDSAGHWALISFAEGISAERIPEYSGGLRISDAIYHVAIDRVATPVIDMPLPAGAAVAVASQRSAAAAVAATRAYDDRGIRTNAVVAARLAANCPCLVGLVVFGTLPELRDLAARPGVRAVEALPADASAAVFARAPLLPEQRDLADAGRNDGPVPDN